MTDTAAARVSRLRAEHRSRQVRWGFIWALTCAVLWGAWYVPGFAIYYEAPFVDMVHNYLLAAFVITVLNNAIAVLIALFVWVAVLGKIGEYVRTMKQAKISRWYLPAGLAGMLAIFGSIIAIAYVGAAFSAVAALLYPIVGAWAAKVWYSERITKQATLGIIVIVSGGVVTFTPGLFAEFTGVGTGGLLGYLGGAMAIVAWILTGSQLWSTVGSALSNPAVLLLLVLLGLTFGFCYMSWYKSFPLIGVGRGQAIAALYRPFALVWLTISTLVTPSWQIVVGRLLAVAASFILFTEKRGCPRGHPGCAVWAIVGEP